MDRAFYVIPSHYPSGIPAIFNNNKSVKVALILVSDVAFDVSIFDPIAASVAAEQYYHVACRGEDDKVEIISALSAFSGSSISAL